MKVFIVYEYNYDDSCIHDVFATKELAQKYIDAVKEAIPTPGFVNRRFNKTPEEYRKYLQHEIDQNYVIDEWEIKT